MEMEIAARESLAAAETDLPEPEDMDYMQFCALGAKNRITFIPMLMAKYLGGYLHPVRHTADLFWHYQGGVWQELPASTIKNICARAMKDDAQPRRISDGISLLAAIVNIEEADWEVQGELINCLTGMVDARNLDYCLTTRRTAAGARCLAGSSRRRPSTRLRSYGTRP